MLNPSTIVVDVQIIENVSHVTGFNEKSPNVNETLQN
jgi:hypothetical protein